jgi:hypothetical protein
MKRPKCSDCWYMTKFYYDDEYLSMKRLYVKDQTHNKVKWIAIGWICPNCGKVVIEARLPLRKFTTVRTRKQALR